MINLTPVVALVTDSNAQLPPELAARYGVTIVPLSVTVNGVAYQEGVDLDADQFYARFADGAKPEVSTSQPSPGQFAAAYSAAAARGATSILSVHIGSNVSGTFNSARLAALDSPIPVELVDTGTASFAIACCLWEAGEALTKGASVAEAAEIARDVAGRVGNVFVVGALELARRGGRLAADAVSQVFADIPVLSLVGGAMKPVGAVRDLDAAAEVMARTVIDAGPGLRVGLGIADAAAAGLWQALESRLAASSAVVDMVRYRIGPSVGAHTGPGTAGAVFYRTVAPS